MYNTNNGSSNSNYLLELLQPYSKEELQSMMMEFAHTDNAIYQVMINRISTDIKWCKLFVHGLAPNTTKVHTPFCMLCTLWYSLPNTQPIPSPIFPQQSLARTFQQFGAVKDAVVLLEQHDRSKGCGFVVFESASSAQSALSGSIVIDGRQVQCDYAFRGNPKKTFLSQPVISPEQRLAADGRRLFIHDLAWKTTNDTLRRAFLQFGDIQEAVVIHDRQTGKSKGYFP